MNPDRRELLQQRRLASNQTDTALSETGRAQVRARVLLVAGLAPDLAFASDLKRAAETSAFLGHAC